MANAVTFVLMMLAAAAIIAVALVWPRGEGAVLPAPFAHPAAVSAASRSALPESSNVAAPAP